MSQHYGWSSGALGYDVVRSGFDYAYAAEFAQVMRLTNAGDRPWGAVGMSVSWDQSVA